MSEIEGCVELLRTRMAEGKPFSITWLNHFSAMQNMRANIGLNGFTFVGIDGLFLRWLVRFSGSRTSADLLLPLVLADSTFSLGLVGGSESGLVDRVACFKRAFPTVTVRWALNGFDTKEDLTDQILKSEPVDLVIIGMGAVRQDELALRLTTAFEQIGRVSCIATCGGWMDQLSRPGYYPSWAYPLRLNWLVRLARDPKRLWRRYTVDAAAAIAKVGALRKFVNQTTLWPSPR